MSAPARTPAAPPRRRTTYERPVTHADVLLAAGGFLLATALGALGLFVLVRFGVDPLAAATGAIPTTVALWFVAVWYALRARGWSWTDLGLGREGARPAPWWWQVPLAYLLVILTATLLVSLLSAPGEQANVMVGGLHFGPVALGAIWLAIVVVGPLVEEILFRRILLGWLEARTGFVLATVLQAALFAVLHVIPAAMVMTFLMGLAAALLARRHRSLWPAFALHLVNNFVATWVLLSVLR